MNQTRLSKSKRTPFNKLSGPKVRSKFLTKLPL